jgi:acetolactate synthase I/II/III large subunit
MRTTGAGIITTLLERQGISVVAGIPGGSNLPLYDALRSSRIRHVLARHEQGAGFIAQGMARATGQVGVCIATSGPGATNLVTAIADAMLDSIPLVAITGQVPSGLIGTTAFQEVDFSAITTPITKHRVLVHAAHELLRVIPEAFRIAQSGRPGPVVIDVPKDVQLTEVELEAWPEPGRRDPAVPVDAEFVDDLARAIADAERPVLYLGGGVIASGASARVRELARRADLPVAVTLHGLGAFPADDPRFLGMLGMHGARHTNQTLDEADLVIALGARFDDRATGKPSEFCARARIAHVDVDPREIGKIKRAHLHTVGDVAAVLDALLPKVAEQRRPAWRARVGELRRPGPRPRFIEALARLLPRDAVVATDVGQHQMWVAQSYPFCEPRTLLSSGGLGTMGFGLPAAIGAALARPETRVVCVSGDGSILMNLQELATLAELDLNVAVLVMNNRQLGMVRQQQELFYGARYHAAHFEAQPDFAAIARGFGLRGVNLADARDERGALEQALAAPGPVVIDCPVHPADNVLPIVPPGAANRDMIDLEAAG